MEESRIREICIEVSEDVYKQILRARKMGYSSIDLIKLGLKHIGLGEVKPLEYKECGRISPFNFKWPDGSIERFDEALCFSIERNVFYVAYGFRYAFGTNRRRLVVYRKGLKGKTMWAIVEFVGVDDWNESKHVASLIKKPDNKFATVKEAKNLPEYKELENYIKDHGDVIKDGKKGFAALVIREDDHEKILYHALTRYKWKNMPK